MEVTKRNVVVEVDARFYLDIPLPYKIDEKKGSAKFDKSKSELILVLPVVVTEEMLAAQKADPMQNAVVDMGGTDEGEDEDDEEGGAAGTGDTTAGAKKKALWMDDDEKGGIVDPAELRAQERERQKQLQEEAQQRLEEKRKAGKKSKWVPEDRTWVDEADRIRKYGAEDDDAGAAEEEEAKKKPPVPSSS